MPLNEITLGHRKSGFYIQMIRLLKKPFPLKKASSKKWGLLKLPKTYYIVQLIIISMIILSNVHCYLKSYKSWLKTDEKVKPSLDKNSFWNILLVKLAEWVSFIPLETKSVKFCRQKIEEDGGWDCQKDEASKVGGKEHPLQQRSCNRKKPFYFESLDVSVLSNFKVTCIFFQNISDSCN